MDGRREELALAVRLLAAAGVVDYNGHASVRGADAGTMLINSGRSVRTRVGPEDIVPVDLDGHPLSDGDPPPMECHLHAAVYRRRPDVQAVVHGHPFWSTLFTVAGVPLIPVTPQSAVLGEIPVFPEARSVNTPELGEAVAATLGAGRVALLRSHGMVAAGGDLVEVFALAVYLEENARRQHQASLLGTPRPLSAEELALLSRTLWKPNLLRKVWDHHVSLMDAGGRPGAAGG